MGRESSRDADDGAGRPERRRHHGGESHDWKIRDDAASHSLPHRRRSEVQRSGTRTSNKARGPLSLDATEPTMPPPRLARASTDGYRRPREAVVYSDDERVSGGRRHSRRELSPTYDYHRRRRQAEYSESSPSSSSKETTDDDESSERETRDEDRETVDEADDEASRERRRRIPGPEDSMESFEDRRRQITGPEDSMESFDDRRRHRRRRHGRSLDDEDRRRHSTSDVNSPGRHPRAPELSESPRRSHRHHHMTDIIATSRPPVASKKPSKRGYQSSEVVYHDSRPRRSNTVGSSRSSNRSSSRRPSSILGSIFSGPPPRRTSPEKPVKLVECVICMGDMPSTKVAKLKCGHKMCNSCLHRLFKLSVNDPQHMPPKCCSAEHIPLKHVDRLFDMAFKKTWNRKFAEYSTRNRIYCPSKKCGEWIKPANIRRENGRKVARCGRCKTKVCGTCNGKWHSSAECPRDEETKQFLEQAKQEGWQRCFKCKVVVELKEGCNHMTCRCGAEFCMICGTKWKNCDCPWFNYENVEPDILHMNIPVPPIRGDLADIFHGDGPPVPAELRRMRGEPMQMRPQGYEEEMHMRRLQEQRDQDLARRLQMYGDLGDDNDDLDELHGRAANVMGIGNASGHFMNDDYRRGGRVAVPPAPGPPGFDRGPDYVTDVNRARGMRGGSMERRLADRLSENRQRMQPRPMNAHQVPPLMGNPMAMHMGMGMQMPPPPMPMPPPGPILRRPTGEEDAYSNAANTPRSERVVGSRISRHYEDEAEVHAPRSRRRREEVGSPKGSAMAGLNGHGRGMNRVFEWRNFVEPGAPEGDVNTAES